MSNAMILGDGAEMNTKPELEIYADDVSCSHGTTTGEINDDQLFYLRARGVPLDEARSILIQSFLGEVTDDIADEDFAQMVNEKVTAWLNA